MPAEHCSRPVGDAWDGGVGGADRPPEAGAQVRILPGAPLLTCGVAGDSTVPVDAWNEKWNECIYGATMPPRRHRQRGHIETPPSGRFRAIVYAGIDPLTGTNGASARSVPPGMKRE